MYKLEAEISNEIKTFLKKKDFFNMLKKHGSPLNILFPSQFKKNAEKYKEIFEKYNLEGKIFFAHKPNKSIIFPKEAQKNNICIDVASKKELENAIKAGFKSNQIEATGPKSEEFLKEALRNNIIINVDSLNELERINKISKKKVNILVRISNFKKEDSKVERFGIEYEKTKQILKIIKNNKKINLIGFSFHSNKNNNKLERVFAINKLINLILDFRQNGFTECNVLNIGGGYQPNFLKNKEDWFDFINKLKNSTIKKEKITLNNSYYGFSFDGKAIKGASVLQDFYNPEPNEIFLENILKERLDFFENREIHKIINENLIELWIEPGKSLLDQTGITVSKIIEKKEIQKENILFLEMNYTNLHSDRNELFTDPILISKNSKKKWNQGCFIVGNLCSELDIIMNHKVFFEKEPESGDILIFINTAAYRMDFIESNTLQNNTGKKIISFNNQTLTEENYLEK